MRKKDFRRPFEIEEAELVQKCREGDDAAIESFIETRLRRIKLILERHRGIEADMRHILADEIVMIVLKHVQKGRYDPAKGTLAGYIQGVCQHHVSNYQRSRYWQTFFIDSTALEILKASDIPNSLVDKIAAIESREYKKDAFESCLLEAIGAEALKKYGKRIREASRKHPVRRTEHLSSEIIEQLDKTNREYDLETKEIEERMTQIIQKLPEHYQNALKKRYYEGLKPGKMAGILKLEVSQVRNILAEARKRIRALWLKKEG